jgi:ubiquinone/menaquinone biosynthesis C-methylase UbiE
MDPEQEKINAYWSEDSDNYDRIIQDELASFRAEAWMKRIREQTGGKAPLRALDCGCGPGFFTILLARAGHRVTGIDGAGGMLEKARRNAAEQGVRAEILEMDCHELSFAGDTFDLVISRNVAHALRDRRRVYAQWLRVLKPGGVLLIFDAN